MQVELYIDSPFEQVRQYCLGEGWVTDAIDLLVPLKPLLDEGRRNVEILV
jgi:hypothetical protein